MLTVVMDSLALSLILHVHVNSWDVYKMIFPVYCLGSPEGTASLLA